MAEKILNTRILLKYDTLANWESKNTILKKGEVGFAGITNIPPVTTETTEGQKVGADVLNPAVLFKVGDGQTAWKNLKWASALAADVYDWAKAANVVLSNDDKLQFVNTDNSIAKEVDLSKFATNEDLEELRESLEADTNDNTTYTFNIVDGKLQVTETPHVLGVAGEEKVTTYDFVTPEELSDILDNYYTKNEIDTMVNGKLHTEEEIKGFAAAEIGRLIDASGDADVLKSIGDLVDYVEENASDIAELVASVGTANTNASNAVTTANGAAETAGQALEKANEALEGAEGAAASAAAAAESATAASTSASLASEKADAASTSASQASDSATLAGQKAEAASSSAEAASGSASAAAGSASTATTKATEAATSANTASTKANEASDSAQTATTKASEAADSASDANSAKEASESARDEAVQAKTAAEAAEGRAEEYANSANQASNLAIGLSDAAGKSAEAAAQSAEAAAQSATNAVASEIAAQNA